MTPHLVLAELRTLVTQEMVGVHAALFDQADDALFDLASRAAVSGEQQEYLDAMRRLRKQRKQVSQQLDQSLLDEFDVVFNESVVKDDHELSELSLISIDEMELGLAAERLASSIDKQFRTAWIDLAALALKLGGRECPLINPLALARGLIKALAPLEMPVTAQLVILKLFERQLAAQLSHTLKRIFTLASKHGIELSREKPRVATHLRPQRDRPAASAARPAVSDTSDETAAADEPLEAEELPPARNQPDETAAAGSIMLLSALRDMFSGYFGSASDASASGGNEHARAESGGDSVGRRNGQVAHSKSAPMAPSSAERQEHSPPPLSSEQLLATLSYLQEHSPRVLQHAVSDRGAELGDLLKYELLQCARDILGLPIEGGIRQSDAQGLTLVGMLFDVLLDQGDYSPVTRAQLIAAAIPFAKVALLDRQMFAHRAHPARRLLNMLAEACDGNQGESRAERELLLRVEAVIKRLNKDFDRNTGIFVELEDRFGRVMVHREQRSSLIERRTTESLRGRERLEEARVTASLEVSSLLGGHKVPAAVERFVRQDWSHHLAMVLLREGESSDAFRESQQIGTALLRAVDACAKGAAPPSMLSRTLMPVVQSTGRHGIDDILQSLQKLTDAAQEPTKAASNPARSDRAADDSAAEPAAEEIGDEIDAALRASGFEIVTSTATAVPAGAPELSGDLALEIDATQIAPHDIAMVSALNPGQWVDLIDAEGAVHAAKLSWVSPISQRLLFVNRSGTRLCLLSPPEAAALIAQGKLKHHQADQPVDRALINVLERIRGNVEAAQFKP